MQHLEPLTPRHGVNRLYGARTPALALSRHAACAALYCCRHRRFIQLYQRLIRHPQSVSSSKNGSAGSHITATHSCAVWLPVHYQRPRIMTPHASLRVNTIPTRARCVPWLYTRSEPACTGTRTYLEWDGFSDAYCVLMPHPRGNSFVAFVASPGCLPTLPDAIPRTVPERGTLCSLRMLRHFASSTAKRAHAFGTTIVSNVRDEILQTGRAKANWAYAGGETSAGRDFQGQTRHLRHAPGGATSSIPL